MRISRSVTQAVGGALLLLGFGCAQVLGDFEVQEVEAPEDPVATEEDPLQPDQPSGGMDAGMSVAVQDNRVCDPVGSVRCDGRALQRCTEVADGTNWVSIQVCASEELCSEEPARCRPQVCEAGQLRCSGANLEDCAPGLDRWSSLLTCDSEAHCDHVTERACRAAPCEAGERRCNDGVIERCREDRLGWDVEQTCDTQQLCESTLSLCEGDCGEQAPACMPPSCAEGETRCNGASFERCNAGRTGWDLDTLCETAELCRADDVQGCQPPVCQPGERICSGADFQLCNSGQTGYDTTATCINAAHCDPVEGCGIPDCSAGQRRCNGRQIEACTEDLTGFESTGEPPCATAELCRTNPNNQVFCQPPVCVPGQFRCQGNRLEQCNAGQTGFEFVQTCETPELCSASERQCKPPVCRAGFHNCQGNTLRRCLPGRHASEEIANCANAGGCNPVTGQCGDPCIQNQPRCNGSIMEICQDPFEGWVPLAFCATPELCEGGVAQGTCQRSPCSSPNQQRCDGNQLRRCNQGQTGFDTIATCNAGQVCDAAGGQCDICNPGALTCTNNNLMRCAADGQSFTLVAACGNGLCSAQAGRCLQCAPAGNVRCAGNGALLQCSADQLREDQLDACGPGLCRADGTSGVCLACQPANSLRCDGATIKRCGPGQLQEFDVEQCESVALCEQQGNNAFCEGPACNATDRRFSCSTEPDPTDPGGTRARVLECNADFTGFLPTDIVCDPAVLCDPSTGTCRDPVCVAGDRACNGNVLQECDPAADRFEQLQSCGSAGCREFGQNDAECRICVPNSRSCNDQGQLVICNDAGSGQTVDNCGGLGCVASTNPPRCQLCGNGERDGNELCDGDDFGNATCENQGFPGGGALTCNSTCSQIDTSGCDPCGDGACGPGENANNCSTDCFCGNGTVENGETCELPGTNLGACDPGRFRGGNVTCDSNCQPSEAACVPLCDGDGECDPEETPEDCPNECPLSPCNADGQCNPGETPQECPDDCLCGNDRADPGEGCDTPNEVVEPCDSLRFRSGEVLCDASCQLSEAQCVLICNQDAQCEPEAGETPENCPSDCGPAENGNAAN